MEALAKNASEIGPQTPIYMIVAAPRKTAKYPDLPRPLECRPEGSLPPLVLNFVSGVPRGVDVALGRIPRRDSAAFVQAIRSADNRSININIDCAGGDAEGALQIADALLRHKFAVTCVITGRCSSMAVAIALAADVRSIIEAGSVLLHGVRYYFTPAQYDMARRLPAKEKQELEGSLNDFDDKQVVLLMQRLGVSEATARRWLAEEKPWTAVEALARNFVHAIDAVNTETTHAN